MRVAEAQAFERSEFLSIGFYGTDMIHMCILVKENLKKDIISVLNRQNDHKYVSCPVKIIAETNWLSQMNRCSQINKGPNSFWVQVRQFAVTSPVFSEENSNCIHNRSYILWMYNNSCKNWQQYYKFIIIIPVLAQFKETVPMLGFAAATLKN